MSINVIKHMRVTYVRCIFMDVLITQPCVIVFMYGTHYTKLSIQVYHRNHSYPIWGSTLDVVTTNNTVS